MATVKILLLVTYYSAVLGQNNIQLPRIALNHLPGHESPGEHPDLQLVTDSPKDKIIESIQSIQQIQPMKYESPGTAEKSTTAKAAAIELDNLIENSTSESTSQSTPAVTPTNLNLSTPNKNTTNFQNAIAYIITLSTYGNNDQSIFPLTLSTSGLLTTLLSGILPGFGNRINQTIIPNIKLQTTTTTTPQPQLQSLSKEGAVAQNTISMETAKNSNLI